MIHNILEYGRAEGGQFERPQRLNIIRLIAKKAEEYELLAHSRDRDFIYVFETERFTDKYSASSIYADISELCTECP